MFESEAEITQMMMGILDFLHPDPSLEDNHDANLSLSESSVRKQIVDGLNPDTEYFFSVLPVGCGLNYSGAVQKFKTFEILPPSLLHCRMMLRFWVKFIMTMDNRKG